MNGIRLILDTSATFLYLPRKGGRSRCTLVTADKQLQKFKEIAEGFPLERLTDAQNFISLLFYFGLLTIKGVEEEQTVLTVPNETARHLYYDNIKEA